MKTKNVAGTTAGLSSTTAHQNFLRPVPNNGLEDGGRYYRPQAGSTAQGAVTAIIVPHL
jgi:hypothetical protein